MFFPVVAGGTALIFAASTVGISQLAAGSLALLGIGKNLSLMHHMIMSRVQVLEETTLLGASAWDLSTVWPGMVNVVWSSSPMEEFCVQSVVEEGRLHTFLFHLQHLINQGL